MGLILPGAPPERSRLLGPDGKTLVEYTRRPVTSVRVTRLDADGQPTGESHTVPVSHIIERRVPEPGDDQCVDMTLPRKTVTLDLELVSPAHWILRQ